MPAWPPCHCRPFSLELWSAELPSQSTGVNRVLYACSPAAALETHSMQPNVYGISQHCYCPLPFLTLPRDCQQVEHNTHTRAALLMRSAPCHILPQAVQHHPLHGLRNTQHLFIQQQQTQHKQDKRPARSHGKGQVRRVGSSSRSSQATCTLVSSRLAKYTSAMQRCTPAPLLLHPFQQHPAHSYEIPPAKTVNDRHTPPTFVYQLPRNRTM